MRKQAPRLARFSVPASAAAILLVAAHCGPAAAQSSDKSPRPPTPKHRSRDDEAIIVLGDRRSVVKIADPLATLDSETIAALGATSMDELMRVIRPLAQSAEGADPIFLLNGQRISGYPEIASLPPEAIDKVEVLPEEAALRFGYPPTRRVLNFITKRNFHQVELRGTVGTTTDPGSTTANANFNLTRLHKDQRFTLALESRHTSSLLQSERRLLPDPDVLFDGIGNVTGLNGGEVDPALSAAAGETVTVAPVAAKPGDRSSLDAYAAAANRPRLFDLGPYRTLVPHNGAWKLESVLADKLGGTLSASLNLTAERSTDRTLSGLAPATLTVPASNPFSPFARTVLLQRYLTEAGPLRIRQTTTTLHGGGTLRGVTAGWQWDLTGTADQKLVAGISERGIDLTAANAAIAAGANPFAPLDPSLVADRLTDRAHLLTRTMDSKLVATNMPIHLPAGDVTVTGTAEAERMIANSVTHGANPFDLHLGRTRTEAGVALDVPLTSRRDGFLAGAGDISLNGSISARRISGFGSLSDRTLGVAWRPFKGIQLQLQDKRSGAAPDMEKLASPVVQIANVPVFDRATGRTEIITLSMGGNPNLLAERRHVRSASLNVKPFPKKDINLSASYEAADIRNEVGDIYALPPALESLFPDRIVRDSNGRLIAETFQPTNFARHRQRTLHMTISVGGPIGKSPALKPGATGDGRAHYYAGAGPSLRFSDRLLLRRGVPTLDLLRGDSVTGGGLPRVSGYFYGGIGYLGNDFGFNGWYQARERVRGDIPAADLTFSSLFKLNVNFAISVHHFVPKEKWTRHLQVKIEIENVTNRRVHVHDRTGAVPNRFQADYLDPIGRTVKLTLRKLF
jgi:hypothetical protein